MKDLCHHCQNYFKPEKPLSFELLLWKLCQNCSHSKYRMKGRVGGWKVWFRWGFLEHLAKIGGYFILLEGNCKICFCLIGIKILLTEKSFTKSLYEELHKKKHFEGWAESPAKLQGASSCLALNPKSPYARKWNLPFLFHLIHRQNSGFMQSRKNCTLAASVGFYSSNFAVSIFWCCNLG